MPFHPLKLILYTSGMLPNIQLKSIRTASIVLTLISSGIMAKNPSSIGCYSDSGNMPILNGIHLQNLNPPSFEPAQIYISCQQFCGKYQFSYFGIQERKICTCGNNLPSKGGKAGEGNCDMICQDNGKESCGGYDYTSVYMQSIEQVGAVDVAIASSGNSTLVSNPSPASVSSPHKLSPPAGSNSVPVTSMPATFIDNTGLMAAVFTLAGVVLLGCGILGFVLYQRRKATEYDLTCDESLQTSYLWQRRSSLSLRDDMDYTKKLRVINPDI
ncbi:hypothetical protein K7432_006226 [Basidiobolus ranarum]|uniref:WSC domain-containing protein n=1 Tax=Basidiobolus ranarum TaxID=34480 RepID=A0ABR2WV89_9FUNG